MDPLPSDEFVELVFRWGALSPEQFEMLLEPERADYLAGARLLEENSKNRAEFIGALPRFTREWRESFGEDLPVM